MPVFVSMNLQKKLQHITNQEIFTEQYAQGLLTSAVKLFLLPKGPTENYYVRIDWPAIT